MARLIITCGIQGSGKSYYVDESLPEKDRWLITGNDRDTKTEKNKKLEVARVKLLDLVIDDMHLTADLRKRVIEQFIETHEIECHYFFSDNESSWQRVSKRSNNSITKSLIKQSLLSLEPPTYEEGFQSIFFHSNHGSKEKGICFKL